MLSAHFQRVSAVVSFIIMGII